MEGNKLFAVLGMTLIVGMVIYSNRKKIAKTCSRRISNIGKQDEGFLVAVSKRASKNRYSK